MHTAATSKRPRNVLKTSSGQKNPGRNAFARNQGIHQQIVGSIVRYIILLSSKIKAFCLSGFYRSRKFQYIGIPLILIILIGLYGFFYIYYPSNKTFSATLFFKYREINEETTISLASNEVVNFVELEEVESVSSFTEATKEKPVGEKAKGGIRIYNTTNEIKEVAKGTKLTCISGSCKSLVYLTQNKLNLSPGGVDDVTVVASDIGENYNLSAGSSRFQVGSYNSDTEVFGSNLQGITGGTPKEFVKIVAKQDIKRAEDEAMKAVKNLLLSTIKNNPSYVDYIISDSSLKVEKISSEPDVSEGDEADVVNITLEARGKVQAVENQQIKSLVEDYQNDVTPEGYYLDESVSSPAQYDAVTTQNGTVEVNIAVNAIARPRLDVQLLRQELKGVKYSQVDSILDSVQHLQSFDKEFTPTYFPQMFWKLPDVEHKISISVKYTGAE